MIKTEGGTFDPKDKYIYFISSTVDSLVDIDMYRYFLIALNEIQSESELASFAQLLKQGKAILLDSGIFNLGMQHARKYDMTFYEVLSLPPEQIEGFEQLKQRYIQTVEQYRDQLWGYVELDFGGKDNKKRIRAELESLGLRPIPVYHPLNDGWDYFDYLAQRYDRICVANVVQSPLYVRKRILATLWERKCSYPKLWSTFLVTQ